ncbi:hypothetical protein Tco_0823355 [Tanacetum coccineum]|uniref:Reverse transcriptase domain-containing protein n=1 Tax=Tanacetum coccineum TaxID=301880 RepID=A0ABQ5AIN9_9ASTR
MPTKIELTLEQSQQGVSNDVLMEHPWSMEMQIQVRFITTYSYSSFQSQSFRIKIVDTKLPQISSKSNQEPYFGEINMTITRSGMTPEAIKELVNRRMEEALAAYEATRAANTLEAKNQSQNGSNGDNGNSENGNGGNENPNENNRGARPIARECTYHDFKKCQPLNFKGTEGVVGLIRWFEKIETVFHISNCPEKYQVKYATCTFLNSALTWWNSHKRTVGTKAAFAMS